MGHVALQPMGDDDLDAVFEMMWRGDADPASAPAPSDEDRARFDQAMAADLASADTTLFTVTEDGDFVGTAVAGPAGDDRFVNVWISPSARGRGVATEALRLLISLEPIRPLFAIVNAGDAAAAAVAEHNGFADVSAERAEGLGPGERLYSLPPVLDGV
ncbi:GNAT family N-acetyltransferase [Microbacterium sp. zg.Y1090]|uniref:GNAT family N-acetyltransferase n=1 Tax=Microbacterium TaxID=33882 RepID=UPI00214ADE17|nr:MULTISPECIES: GNAT family N-acetyltransferase [unclassified Microbacterium]MCR2813049.1 GNAT family N-acetyltransferase [Microbacterium sp. zg.Y1084]MCR2819363.1 GNAT family N-acetyltransferase [Microbacterium sp. zg.Y1090]MDL5487280.1 GNAT family N-acetyltransferase [Microbacterium sp. zg-Y1211]WIM28343.1 GNAT family N-acetyltransferase [Microbacterium sp. zg-Y1090]